METWDTLDQTIIQCRKCPRLVAWREQVARERKRAYRDQVYWGKPVTGFGDRQASALVVGLAPGAHGANRTGRMFTGDGSGEFLYQALYQAGFASQPRSISGDDGLQLAGLYISAVCRCAPPDNRPTPGEITNCLPFLEWELEHLPQLVGMVALGQIAFDNLLCLVRQRGFNIPRLRFAHGAFYRLGENLPWLLASYHPSRQNTQTGRLTVEMFAGIWARVHLLLDLGYNPEILAE
jgi:uracil-DNA glycosylase family 4